MPRRSGDPGTVYLIRRIYRRHLICEISELSKLSPESNPESEHRFCVRYTPRSALLSFFDIR